MLYYPIYINVKRETVVVVGGGAVAQRKIETLLEYGAEVKIISRDLTPTLSQYVEEGMIEFVGSEFRKEFLDGAFMVFAATDDPTLNSEVSQQFGHAPYFALYDLDNETIDYINNTQTLNSARGAGIQSARHVIDADVCALLSGHCGPKAFRTLHAGDINIYVAEIFKELFIADIAVVKIDMFHKAQFFNHHFQLVPVILSGITEDIRVGFPEEDI